jgi:hypothetical protein
MPGALEHAKAAWIPLAELGRLGRFRGLGSVFVVTTNDHAWIRWQELNDAILPILSAIPGVQFFRKRGSQWHRLNEALPAWGFPPPGNEQSLESILFPMRLNAKYGYLDEMPTVPLTLVRNTRVQPTTLMRCWVEDLKQLVSQNPELIDGVSGLHDGEVAWLRGSHLPALPGSMRFWGKTIHLPLGYQLDPPIAEVDLIRILAIDEAEIAAWWDDHWELFATYQFEPLTVSGVQAS